MDAILIDDNLMQLVVVYLDSISEPQQLWDWSAADNTVEACHLAFLGVAVHWDFSELRSEVLL